MTKPYDEQAGFRKKAGEKDFKIRRVGGRSQPAAEPARDSGWTLLDQVAGKKPAPASTAEPEVPAMAAQSSPFASAPPAPVAAAATASAVPAVAARPAEPVDEPAARPRFRSLLSGQPEHATEAVSGAYNGTPLKALLRRIAERQAMNRPSGFDEWR
ncbi:MAG: hypothetical protein ABGX87_16995 [Alcanivorax sp.]